MVTISLDGDALDIQVWDMHERLMRRGGEVHGVLNRKWFRTDEATAAPPLLVRYACRVNRRLLAIAALISVTGMGCDEATAPAAPAGAGTATVRIVFMGLTARRTDFPPSAQACLDGVGATHTHPSWRNFAAIPLQPIPPDRYEIVFTDVPVATRVSFRINDQNACDANPTGAVTRNVFANDVRLTQNTTTPGNGDEPGFALTVAVSGAISQ